MTKKSKEKGFFRDMLESLIAIFIFALIVGFAFRLVEVITGSCIL